MDRISSHMLRCALLWLVAGGAVGALMLLDRHLPGSWQIWFGPTHGHMLFVGWLLQFAVGVGYWLLPRRRTADLPLGYRENTAMLIVVLLNLGLLCRVVAEPLERTGQDSNWIFALLVISAVAQLLAFVLVAVEFWGRVAPRAIARSQPPAS